MALLFFENLLVGRQDGALYQELFGEPEDFDPFSTRSSWPRWRISAR